MTGETTPLPLAAKPRSQWRWLRMALWFVLAMAVLFLAAIYALKNWLLPDLTVLQPRIEAALTQAIKQPVRIQGMGAQWNWLSADVHLDRVSIGPLDAPLLHASGIKTTLLAHPLLLGTVQTDGFNVDQLTFLAQQTNPQVSLQAKPAAPARWLVAGFDMAAPSDGAALRWVLNQPSLRVKQMDVHADDAAKHWVPGGKATLSLADLMLTASGLNHEIKAQFSPLMDDARLGKNVGFEANFTHRVLGDKAALANWSGQAHLTMPDLHMARTASWLLPLTRNERSTQAAQWQQWAQRSAVDARLNSVTTLLFDAGKWQAKGSVSVRGLPKQNALDPSTHFAPVVWAWKSLPNATPGQITSHAVQLGSDTVSIAPVLGLLRGAPLPPALQSAVEQSQAQGTLSNLSIDAVFDPKGVSKLTAKAQVKQLGINSTDIAGAKGVINIPTLSGVSGSVNIQHTPDKTTTLIRLDSQNAYAELPQWLAEPRLGFDSLSGSIEVVLKPQQIAMAFDQLRFSNADAAGELNGDYTVATAATSRAKPDLAGLGVAKIRGQFARANLAQLHRYMPLSLSDIARSWLRQTIAQGAATDLQFNLQGDVSRFPFLPNVAQAGERFDLQAQIDQAVLNFNPPTRAGSPVLPATDNKPWPLIEDVTGQLRLNGLAMTLMNMQGTAARIPLHVPKLSIANLTQPVVVFQTRATASAQNVLNLIRSTPLSQRLGAQFEALKATGNLSVDAHLTLDIANPINNLHEAVILADQANLTVSADIPPFERINAKLLVQQNNTRIEQATAFWLGGLVQLSGELNTQDPSKKLRAEGTVQLADVTQAFTHPMVLALLKHAQGNVSYALDVAFKPEGVAWAVATDFKNAALQWPGLLDKAVGVPLPFTLSRSPAQRSAVGGASNLQAIDQDLWDAQLGTSLLGSFKATVERQLQGDAWSVTRGAIALGDSAELNTPDQGLGIHIATPKVNLDQLRREIESLPWDALPQGAQSREFKESKEFKGSKEPNPIKQGEASTPTAKVIEPKSTATVANENTNANANAVPAWMPSILAVQVDDLTLAGRHFYNIAGAALRDTDPNTQGHSWRGNLAAKGINGYFSWIDTGQSKTLGDGAVVLQLAELAVPAAEIEQTSQSLLKLSPEQVPSVDIRIDRLSVGDKNLGALVLKASNIGKTAQQTGWQIDQLALTLPHASISATGQWLQTAQAIDGAGQVSMDLAVKTDSLGDTLTGFGYGKLLAETAGTLDGKVQWQGTPFSLNLPTLSGQINAQFDKGRFLKIDPGAGKLVGLFSLQNLPRRLTLDFKDTFSEGFAFNAIQTSATIAKGQMTLDTFDMASGVAAVKATGQVSLVDETQSLMFVVKPDVNAGSVSLLYMLINPPLGLATLAAQFLLREPISKAFTLEYAITGSWANPEVKQVKRAIQ